MLALSATSFHGCIAEWRGRSEGTIELTSGMTRVDAQRRSTIPLLEYGDSNYYFDFVLAGESLRFRHLNLYGITWNGGVVEHFTALSEKHVWTETRRDVQRAEQLLLARGWIRDRDTQPMSTLTDNAREAAHSVYYDTAIRRTFYNKGNLQVEISACGEPGGMPWYRFANEPRMFWLVVGVYPR